METSIGELKANLSAYIKKAAGGEAVTITVHNRPIARIVPIKAGIPLANLAELHGVQWNGGKPAGPPKGEIMRKGKSLSAWVKQNRRRA